MTIPDMRKKLGSPYSFFQKLRSKTAVFLQAFVCGQLQVQGFTTPNRCSKKRKTVPKTFFKNRENLPDTFLLEMRKNGGHRARFCSTNKTVFYRHWHSCQTSQIKWSQTMRFSSRPLHRMDWTWRSLLNSELWTSSIAIRFRSSRWSRRATSQLGRATLRWLGTVLGRTKCANFFVKTYCL